jgi:Sec-independent protein secretion pathway component TatC
MWFNVGNNELGIVCLLALVAAVLALLRLHAWRWAMIGLVCATVAAIFSPADPVSTILLGTLFFLFFLGGNRFGVRRSTAAK